MSRWNFSTVKKTSVFLALLFFLFSFWMPGEVFADEGDYTTDLYDVKIDVQEDRTMQITETIKVNFKTPQHGIYRNIPRKHYQPYKINDKKGFANCEMEIDQVTVDDDDYTCQKEAENYTIKIGDPNAVVDGEQTYKISYRCRMYDDMVAGDDILLCEVLPVAWETAIENAKVTINMPKRFDSEYLNVSSVGPEKEEYSGKLDWNIAENQIVIESKGKLPKGVGILTQVALPEDYFSGELALGWRQAALILVAILCAVATFLLWVVFGRNKRMARTVAFYPPENKSPLDLSYALAGGADTQDNMIMILYLADKGYLSIRENVKGKFIVRKLKDLPKDAPRHEQVFMDGLFTRGKSTTFLPDKNTKFQKACDKVKDILVKTYRKDAATCMWQPNSKRAHVIGFVLTVLPVGLGLIAAHAEMGEKIYSSIFMWIVLLLLYLGGVVMYGWRYNKGKLIVAIQWALRILIVGVLVFLGYKICIRIGLMVAAAIVTGSLITYFFTRRMRKLTPYGRQLMEKILGFRRFIKTAKPAKLTMLAEENPSYFYNILPYTYMFGLSGKWAKRFKSASVEPPAWYHRVNGGDGFNTLSFVKGLRACFRAMIYLMFLSADSSSGSSSSSQDSGSSFGSGGDSSGGGDSGGGGGGGSW